MKDEFILHAPSFILVREGSGGARRLEGVRKEGGVLRGSEAPARHGCLSITLTAVIS
jgi:hypothetical protein